MADIASGAAPVGFNRYLRQPHKAPLMEWGEYRLDGYLIMVQKSQAQYEAYQQVSVRSDASSPWTSVRWLLHKVDGHLGSPHSQWMVDAVFVAEPDTPDDDAFRRAPELQACAARTGLARAYC